MSLALMLLGQVMTVMPTTAAVTPASVTIPQYEVACIMHDVDGSTFNIGFRQTGGRGYAQSSVNGGAPGVGWTPIETVVTTDTSGRYLNQSLWTSSASERGWPGAKQSFPVVGKRFQTQFLSVATTEPNKILLQIQPNYPLGDVQAFGLCDVRKQDQTPLSDDEAKRQFRK